MLKLILSFSQSFKVF